MFRDPAMSLSPLLHYFFCLPTNPLLLSIHLPVKMQAQHWTDTIATTIHLLCSQPPSSSRIIPGLRAVSVSPPQNPPRARSNSQILHYTHTQAPSRFTSSSNISCHFPYQESSILELEAHECTLYTDNIHTHSSSILMIINISHRGCERGAEGPRLSTHCIR
jgi:hypothetical protein